ncbi:MAG: UDP-N-acetylglucosamine 1-carboxyvinyltransferase, partial [Candidatus Aenigmarchaeota archaeon]|nr:UDP-N-acetylglucosamine 1-carboxyvinyltransferase [Candidatus Aenigmarchaeota archaeon]
MAKFVIQQSKHLEGEVSISGMKNATTPILVATLLTNQPCVISNIPRIKDVEKMIEILISIGSQVKWLDRHTIEINNQHVVSASLNKILVRSMRSSVLLLGAGLARFSKIILPEPGGCIIGNRPLDTHFYALKKLGVKIEQKDGNYNLSTKQLVGNYIVLPEFSVTATENTSLASVLARG